ncbi:hypothetical protein E3N88_00921 [Mikania micrantha]|uniref:Uncharacterized protein n=1 Tax=Mikania micrantha TaxID=192012 RepID=A0A5N6PZI5_9ASTR|nr:hypothetical protein E3N88_00921 [Mikania micrantha]
MKRASSSSSQYTKTSHTGPLLINTDDLTLTLNPNAWTQMANIVSVDMPAGTGFSYAETQEGWISSDTILASDYKDFIKKFLSDNPKFLRNPLYISGISYSGIIIPKVTLELYEGNERGDQPSVNIQGYILCSPLTNKFMDFNSRLEYAHRMALISDDIYQSAINNCNGNYVDTMRANSACRKSLLGYEKCTSRINFDNILEPVSDDSKYNIGITAINNWANMEVVQQALNVHQGMVGKFDENNYTIHYSEGKNDTICYAYDIFSSFSYHKKLSAKSCRALIFSGDHDLTFPYVGVEQWISSLNLEVEAPWEPFYVDNQVGGYLTRYELNNYSLSYATIKGSGHVVDIYKPKEAFVLVQRWFSTQAFSSDS